MLAAVTGATGFIGSHLVEDLARKGWSVRSLTRKRDRRAPAGLVSVDYRDQAALSSAFEGAEVVFHLAGATRAPKPRQLFAANVELTQAVMTAAHRAGVP